MNIPVSTVPFRIEARAVLLCVTAVLPFLIFFVWLAWADLDRQVDDSHQEASSAALLIAGEFSQVRRMTAQMLAAYSTIADKKAPLASLCDERLRRMMEPVPLIQAAIADVNGDLQCGISPIPTGANIRDREYFGRTIATREFATSGFVTSRSTGRRAIAAGFPLLDSRNLVRGVLAVSIDLTWLYQLMLDVHLPQGASAEILDSRGHIIARYPEDNGVVGARVPNFDQFLETVSKGPAEDMRYRGVIKSEPIVAGAVVREDPLNPAYVRVEIPDDVVTGNARKLLAQGCITTLIVLAIAALFSRWTARRLIVYPVQQLTAAARRMDIDELSVRTGYVNDGTELGELASSFDRMAERLQRSVRALRALSAGNRTIIRPQTEPALIQAMCRVAVDVGGYAIAMVHYALDDEEKTLSLRAHAGSHENCASVLHFTWTPDSLRRGPPGIALTTGRYCVVQDIENDRRTVFWKDKAAQNGFASIISLPLTVEETIIGTYTLIAHARQQFDEHEIELLGEMAADLAFGISTIRAREENARMQDAADFAARHDKVTGIPNRTEVVSQTQEMITAAPSHVCVLVVYIPIMHELIDTLGHEAANDIVQVIAGRLSRMGDEAVVIGRIAMDEFAYVCVGDAECDEPLAELIQRTFERPVDVHGAAIEVQSHVGIASYPEHGSEGDLLLRRAGSAARQAMNKERHILLYHPVREEQQLEQIALVSQLREAIQTHQLELHHQPKFRLDTMEPIGFEALVRWRKTDDVLVPPGAFIPLAERTGLILGLTYEVISLALTYLSKPGHLEHALPIAINVTARSLYDEQFVNRLLRSMAHLKIPPRLLQLEITESALMQEPAAAMKTVHLLREAGIDIYIDDFGTGYSSMSYLVQLPVSGLKIDRSFIQQMTQSPRARAVVASIISMSQRLRLEVVAEGVESAEEVEILKQLQCDAAQGYFLGRPALAKSQLH